VYSEPLLIALESSKSIGGTANRLGSATSSNSNLDVRSPHASAGSANSTNLLKKMSKKIFEYDLHVYLMQLIENSNELCLVHASLNILVQIANLEYEKKDSKSFKNISYFKMWLYFF
jgi:hypothetical protein